jgi:hypothetical protein
MVQGNNSLSNSNQQQGDTHQGQVSGEWQRYPELQPNHPVHTVRQEALEHHPELRIRTSQAPEDTFTDSREELVLINIPKENVIPTFLTVTAKDTEPFEPKTLQQAINDSCWPK